MAEARAHALEETVARLTAVLNDTALYNTPDGIEKARTVQSELQAAREDLDAALEAWAAADERIANNGSRNAGEPG
jgi:hypothetical protein